MPKITRTEIKRIKELLKDHIDGQHIAEGSFFDTEQEFIKLLKQAKSDALLEMRFGGMSREGIAKFIEDLKRYQAINKDVM